MVKFIINFLKRLQYNVNNSTKMVLQVSIFTMLLIIISTFIVQYKNTILEKKQKDKDKVIFQIENDIKLFTSEYVSLISPYKLKKLSNFYLPSFKEITISNRISVNEFN